MTGQLLLWEPEPCHQADPTPALLPRIWTTRPSWIDPESGRASGGWRQRIPASDDDLHIETITPPGRFL